MKAILTFELTDAALAAEGYSREQVIADCEELRDDLVAELPEGVTFNLEIVE
jgi:hypothetical protein